ncbi:MAG: YbhB/YbcL family Raf kinase inhibitor-like protein [Dokdonella sp.]
MRSQLALFLAVSLGSVSATAIAGEFVLDSQSLSTNANMAQTQIYNQGECRGGNVSPQLSWSGAPQGTRSYAITMLDLDANGGRGWWHWALFDIDAKTTSLSAGAGDANGGPLGSVSATNSFGDLGYSGPCPPKDEKMHRYVVTVYALGTERLGLAKAADAAAVTQALQGNALATATLQAEYGR